MSFEAKDHMDVTTPIPMDETLAKLRRVMPEKHPVLVEVELCFERSRSVIEDWMDFWDEDRADRADWPEVLVRLVDRLEAWKAGIADWSEVEAVLKGGAGEQRPVGARIDEQASEAIRLVRRCTLAAASREDLGPLVDAIERALPRGLYIRKGCEIEPVSRPVIAGTVALALRGDR